MLAGSQLLRYKAAAFWPIPAQKLRWQLRALGAALDHYLSSDRENEARILIPLYLDLSHRVYGPAPAGDPGALAMLRKAQLGGFLARVSGSERGADQFEEALDWFSNRNPQATPLWIRCLMQLGGECVRQKRYAEGVELLERAAALRRETSGSFFELAQCQNHLSVAYHHLGCLDRAEASVREALRMHEHASPGGAGVTRSLNNLAQTLLKAGRGEEAEASAIQAVALCLTDSEFLGPVSDTLADIYESKGALHAALHTRDRAMEHVARQKKHSAFLEFSEKQRSLLERMGRPQDALCYREAEDSLRRQQFFAQERRAQCGL